MPSLELKIKNYELCMKKYVKFLIAFGALCAVCVLSSCNVTRTITTESRCWQRGDTSVVITTKTVETYDASKKL